jgi:hypothetical protein
MIRRNSLNLKTEESVGAARSGRGLLAGLLRCGRCGRKLHVRYWGRKGTAARYLCRGDFDAGGEYCIGFGGARVDRIFSQKVLEVISPLGVDASFRALDEFTCSEDLELQSLEGQCEQLEYEVQRAFEQYDAVDARNRLVAAELERRWNAKLEALETTQKRIADLDRSIQRLSSEEKQQIRRLGRNFEEIWYSDVCPTRLRKEILRTVIEEVTVNLESETNLLRFIIHWKGGCHTEFSLKKMDPGAAQRTPMEALEIIRRMAVRYGDDQIASVLNRLGYRTGKGMRWTQTRVATARRNHLIRGQKRAKPDPEVLTLNQAAKNLNVSPQTIRRLVEAGYLAMQQVAPRAPWEIRRSDLDTDSIRRIIDRLHRTGKLDFERGSVAGQGSLFSENKGVDNARHHV